MSNDIAWDRRSSATNSLVVIPTIANVQKALEPERYLRTIYLKYFVWLGIQHYKYNPRRWLKLQSHHVLLLLERHPDLDKAFHHSVASHLFPLH